MNPTRPTTGHLRLQHLFLLRALSSTGNLHRAATILHRTQPAVTKMLQELETSLGTILFERGRMGTRPTASGKALTDRAQVILNEWSSAQDQLQAISSGHLGVLHIGATPLTTLALMPKVLASLQAKGRKVRLQFREASIRDLLAALSKAELDCVIGRFTGEMVGEDIMEGLRQEKLYDEQLCVVARPDHTLVKRRRIAWRDLAGFDWVMPSPQLTTRQILNTAFIRAGLMPPPATIESSSFVTNIYFAHQLGLLAVVPVDAAYVAQSFGLVKVLRVNLEGFSAPISMVRRRGAVESELLSSFLEEIRRTTRGKRMARVFHE